MISSNLVKEAFDSTGLTPSNENDFILGKSDAVFALALHTGAGMKTDGANDVVCRNKFIIEMGVTPDFLRSFEKGWRGEHGSGEAYDIGVESRKVVS